MKSLKDHEFNSVTLTLNLSAKTNEILSRTAARSGRTKRQEAC
ncbi:TraY domain-containing protein [Serratia ureilytica]